MIELFQKPAYYVDDNEYREERFMSNVTEETLRQMDAYWRAANYLSAGQDRKSVV